MKATVSTSSSHKSVKFIDNGSEVMVFVLQDGDVWFEIGNGFNTLKSAINKARKAMIKEGYPMNETELAKLLAA